VDLEDIVGGVKTPCDKKNTPSSCWDCPHRDICDIACSIVDDDKKGMVICTPEGRVVLKDLVDDYCVPNNTSNIIKENYSNSMSNRWANDTREKNKGKIINHYRKRHIPAHTSYQWTEQSKPAISFKANFFSTMTHDESVDEHSVVTNSSTEQQSSRLEDETASQVDESSSPPMICHQSEHDVARRSIPLPSPLPKPEYSFKRRILPPNLISFNSTEGKSRLLHALQTKNAEAYIPLSQQFVNQMDPAFCGISTLIVVLNALAIDPNVRWRGGWRWYGDERMLLDRCCLEEERVRREGISIEQYCGLARCQGAVPTLKRSMDDGNMFSLEEFRQDIINAVCMPPLTDWDDSVDLETKTDDNVCNNGGGYFLVTSFARSSLGQTGDGHFSPIAAYHPPTDSCLVLDVARFKYSPFWVPVKELYDAMIPVDTVTGKSRGWILMYPPPAAKASDDMSKIKLKKTEELEGKRPSSCVLLAGTGGFICPVEKIKVEYCSVSK
jgi:glutathione gamma-glutamylcysteinyltransferase